ncbi:MAG: sugar transferase, partial [Lachnospiraceae bacterium]|nr:sugar transferase [Lachnospiraceae bacterium]
DMHHILIVSTYEEAPTVISNFKKITYNYNVVGVCIISEEDRQYPKEIEDALVVATDIESAYDFAVRNVVDEVFIYIPNANNKTTGTIANRFLEMGITVHINLDMLTTGLPNLDVDRMCDYLVMTGSVNVMSPVGAAIKRLFDIVSGVIGCLVTIVLAMLLTPMIMIADPGPVFFSQDRVGKNGRIFKIYKFRSMYVDAEQRKKELMNQNKMEGHMFKMDTDPRIIGSGPDGTRKGLGHWMRALSLDEFPNFYSILKGDMSVVGTRPPTVDEYNHYNYHHKSRLAAKPGLTGMWQVSGRSDITDFEEIVEMDNEYIRNWSFGLDVKIILKTVLVVLKRKGSV